MKRREFLGVVGATVALPFAARAQQTGKAYHIGLLGGASAMGPLDARRKSLTSGLAQRGFVEGRNITFEQRWADGRIDRLGALAGEL